MNLSRASRHSFHPVPNTPQQRRKAILHTEVGGSYGGSVRALELYLEHCDRNAFDHDVLFFYPTPGTERLRSFARKVLVLNEAAAGDSQPASPAKTPWLRSPRTGVRASLSWWLRFLRTLPVVPRLQRIMTDAPYDLVHVNNTFTFQGETILAASRAGIPVVAHMRNPLRRSLYGKMIARWVKTFISVNKAFAAEISGWLKGVSAQTCADGMVLKQPVTEAVAEARRIASGGRQILVGSAGRLHEQKGFDVLIEAAKTVCARREDVAFAIAGEGPLREQLQSLIHDAGLQDRFRLVGFRSDVENFLAALDLFVCSSNWEGLPLAILEAMALAKPVVSTRAGGACEVVLPGVTGEAVDVGDSAGLAQAILLALERMESSVYDASRMQQLARAWADPDTSAARIDQVFGEVISSRAIAEATA